MWGYPGLLELADRIVRQQELAPAIYAASPGVDGPGSPWPYTQLIEDPAAADALIGALRDEGWRWIKVYPHLARPVYEAVLAAAARLGAWNCPTLAIIAIYARTQDPQGTAVPNRKRMVGALRDAGARLLAGT